MGSYQAHPTAHVENNSKIGDSTRIWHFSHIRENSEIGKNCNLGKGVYIDTNVKIGNNVKIQNNVSVYMGVEVEDDVFLGPHVAFTNDLYPRAFNNNWKIVRTKVKKGASIGANSTVVCGITVGNYAMIGSGSVVTKDVPDYALVYGNPARLHGFVCTCGKKLENIVEKTEKLVKYRCSNCNAIIEIKKEDHDLLGG